jgi:hypothetical protein
MIVRTDDPVGGDVVTGYARRGAGPGDGTREPVGEEPGGVA